MDRETNSFKRFEQGAELSPSMDGPKDLAELIEMAEREPESIHYFFTDEDIMAMIPRNPRLAEKIILAAHRHVNTGGSDAA